MGPLPFNWQDELDRLRQEQNPKRYKPHPVEGPYLRLPLPLEGPPPSWRPSTVDQEGPREVILDR